MNPHDDEGEMEGRRSSSKNRFATAERTVRRISTTTEGVMPTQATTAPGIGVYSACGNQAVPRDDEDAYTTLTSRDEEQARWNHMVFPDTSRSTPGTTSIPASISPAGAAAASQLGHYYKEKHDGVEEAKVEEQARQVGRVHPDASRSDVGAAMSCAVVNNSGNQTSSKQDRENGRCQGREQELEVQERNDATDTVMAAGAATTTASPPPAPATGAFAVHGNQTVQRGGQADTFTQFSEVGSTAQCTEQNTDGAEPNQNTENGSTVLVQAHLAQPTEEVLDYQDQRIQQLEERLWSYERQQQPTAPVVHAEIASIAPMESHDNNDDEAPPPPPPPVEEEPTTVMEENLLNEKCFENRRSRLIGLGVLLLLIGVAVAVAIPLSIDSNSSPNALLPDGSWKPLGQELGGKAERVYFGRSVSLSRDSRVMAVGASQCCDGSRPGYVSVFKWDDSTRSWVAKGQELMGEANDDHFGSSVALDGDGTILAVGAFLNTNGNGYRAGHVRVFEHNTSTNRWVQLGSDIDGERQNDWFGYSVSLSKAGNILAAGADNGKGSVRTFQYDRQNNSWEPLGQTLFGQADNDGFGSSVSLSRSGTVVAVGAPWNDLGGINAGQVSMYEYNSALTHWLPMGSPINGQVESGRFGTSVSLDNSGVVVAVGQPGTISDEHVFVYAHDSATSEWTQRGQTIESQEPGNNGFGSSVSLNGNGNALAVGSRYHDANGFSDSGQVTIVQYNANALEWDAVGELLNGKAADDFFGGSVSLSEKGTVVAVGASGRNFNDNWDAGSASVYTLN